MQFTEKTEWDVGTAPTPTPLWKSLSSSSYFTAGAKRSKPSSLGEAQLPVFSLPWSGEKKEEPLQEGIPWNESIPPSSDITGTVRVKEPSSLAGLLGLVTGEQGSSPTSPRQLERNALQS